MEKALPTTNPKRFSSPKFKDITIMTLARLHSQTLKASLSAYRQEALSNFVYDIFIPVVEAEGFRIEDLIGAMLDYAHKKMYETKGVLFKDLIGILASYAQEKQLREDVVWHLQKAGKELTEADTQDELNREA
jgi:hypothetical protein